MITITSIIQNRTVRLWTQLASRVTVFGLAALFLWLYYPQLGSYPLREWDESIYAQVARQSTHAFVFEYIGQAETQPTNLWFEKPPLVIWLVQLSQHVFGVNEFAARASMPLFAVGIFFLVFLWAKDITQSKWAGFFAIAAFFVIPHFLIVVGLLTYDIPIAFFLSAALLCYSRRNRAQGYVYAFWLAVGLGVLTKSIVGLLPLPIVFLDSLVARDFRWLSTRRFWLGPLLCLVVVVPWHIVETVQFGKAFWHTYLYIHVLMRGASSLENHGAPFWYYTYIFQQHPFFELFISALIVCLYKLFNTGVRRMLVLPIVAGVGVFCFFSISVSKLVHYIVPFYPFAALLIGVGLYWILALVKNRWIRWTFSIVTICVLLLFGYQTNQYRLIKMQSPVFTDTKEIAEWIGQRNVVSGVEYRSLATATDVLDTRPLLTYYLNRFIYSTNTTLLIDQNPVYRTRTHVVYLIDGRYVVVALRYIP